MGYTHSWRYGEAFPSKEEYINVLMDIEIAMRDMPSKSRTAGGNYDDPIVLRGGLGEGEPVFSMDEIWFNGDVKTGLDHETFHFQFGKKSSDFCKTARKPYDFMVCIVLLSLANRMTGFTYSTDGDLEDWQPAIDFYRTNIGSLKPSVLHRFEKVEH